jgi:hypothetical protein
MRSKQPPRRSPTAPLPNRNDPYLVLLRRELTRAQARLRRAERERDQALAALAKLQLSMAQAPRRHGKG